jgi:HrpA-like RNA helicase
MPAELYHRFYDRMRKNIAVTQPRVLTAIDIPQNQIVPFNTAEMLKASGKSSRTPLILGENIGFQTGPESKRPMRGLIFMTIGVIVQQMNIMSDEDFMNKYSHIIIDEAHERSTDTDTAMYSLKKFIERNYKKPECPFLIVTSATFDTKKYADYLLDSIPVGERYKNIIRVRGSTFPIEEHFLPYDSTDFIRSALDTVERIHVEHPEDFLSESELKNARKADPALFVPKTGGGALGEDNAFRDIIIFVSGGAEVKKLVRGVEQLNSRHPYFRKYPVFPVQLTGDVVTAQSEDYRNLFADINKLRTEIRDRDKKSGKVKVSFAKPVRRVIAATNVGETGITIDTLRYVIDTGFVNSSEYAPNYNVDMLINKPVTQSMYKQRRGRSGRKAPGTCYAMYTKETLDLLQEDQYPAIIKEHIALVVLNLLVKELDIENRNNNETLYELFVAERANTETGELTEALASTFEKELGSKKINLYKMDLLDLPSADALQSALEMLFTLGAVNSNSIPTPIGFIMNKFRMIAPESVRMILAGYAWGAPVIDLVTIAAFLEEKSMSLFPRALAENYEKAHRAGLFTLFPNGRKISRYSELKSQLFVADDFIRFVIIFVEFQRMVAQVTRASSGITHLNDLRAWCNERGVAYDALVRIVAFRDGVINNMAAIGLDAFTCADGSLRNIAGSYSDDEKMDYIRTIKQCIFEGYKLNIAIWDTRRRIYKTRKANLPLTISSPYFEDARELEEYGDTNPKFIIYGKSLVRRDARTNMYNANAEHICVLDGYIPYDANFDTLA